MNTKMNTKKIIDPVYAHNYLVKEYSRLPRVDDAVIPLKLHLFWHNKQLPPKMHENVELLKSTNPEFEVVVYDGDMAREYIKTHFSEDADVLKAYDTLIPVAFKCDLFRYCLIYKEGGIYLDIKFEPMNGFKLLHLAKWHEVWASEGLNIINNGIIVSAPGNPILGRAVNMIKYNVKNRITGKYPTSATGPQLLTDALLSISGGNNASMIQKFKSPMFKIKAVFYPNAFDFDFDNDNYNKLNLTINGSGGSCPHECILLPIFRFYKGYRKELVSMSPQMHWSKMWEKGEDFVFKAM
jgi:mannosyltransferase OCH1-like enzyme